MDRRTFLTGILGLTGAAALATIAGPADAIAGVPNTRGILDELEASPIDAADDGGDATVELVDHRRGHWRDRRHRHHHHHRRGHRRRVWRRVCRRYWRHGHWRRRCHRERVWVWHYR